MLPCKHLVDMQEQYLIARVAWSCLLYFKTFFHYALCLIGSFSRQLMVEEK